MSELLAIQGFVSGEILQVEAEADQPVGLTVQYRIDSRENLQSYFDNHAPKLREGAIAK